MTGSHSVERNLTLRFTTPAFLGGADGSGELRTPPLKAVLRRWWRVAWVRGRPPDHAALREAEGRLFGHAWLKYADEHGKEKTWANRSRVRIVAAWQEGKRKQWPSDPAVFHPEVQNGRDIGSYLYLGYGPLTYKRGEETSLARPPAIDSGTPWSVKLRYPQDAARQLRLDDVLELWRWFGTIGGRSRNGWGSFEPRNGASAPRSPLDPGSLGAFARRFEDCFDAEWPHALGRDDDDNDSLLLWRTKEDHDDWERVIQELARVKIAFRTALPFSRGRGIVEDRHLLGYPITHHPVEGWRRLSGQVGFKVVPVEGGKLRGIAFHFPHALPDALATKLPRDDRARFNKNKQVEVWKKVHEVLDMEMERWTSER